MGELDNTFMYQRYAQLYVEIYRAKGKQVADDWWIHCKYKPDATEFKTFNNEVRRLLGQGQLQ